MQKHIHHYTVLCQHPLQAVMSRSISLPQLLQIPRYPCPSCQSLYRVLTRVPTRKISCRHDRIQLYGFSPSSRPDLFSPRERVLHPVHELESFLSWPALSAPTPDLRFGTDIHRRELGLLLIGVSAISHGRLSIFKVRIEVAIVAWVINS